MPYMETITEGQAIVIAEALLDKGIIHPAMISGRRQVVDIIIDAGRVEIGQVFIPAGDYEDWFEDIQPKSEDVQEFRYVSPAEKEFGDALLRLIDESKRGG
jgi:hypothetical protein